MNHDYAWKKGIQHCKDYIAVYGDLKCGCKYVADDGYHLGQWISKQRHYYKVGTLKPSQVDQLSQLGVLDSKFSDSWINGCKHAEEYISYTDNHEIPIEYCCADGFKLGAWVSYARRCMRNSDIRTLTDMQRKMFFDLGIIIDKQEYAWHIGFKHAEEFWYAHHNLYVPAKFVCEDGYRLGAWIAKQRKHVRCIDEKPIKSQKSILEHVVKLNEIGMLWSAEEIKWYRDFSAAVNLYNANGYISIYKAKNHYRMEQLSNWIKMTKECITGNSDKFSHLIQLYDKDLKTILGGRLCSIH